MATEKEEIIISVETEGVEKANEKLNEVKESTKSLRDNLTGLGGGVGSAFGLMFSAIDKVKEGFGSLRSAIISTGLGALVVVVASLVEYFKSTAGGQELWGQAMSKFNAVVKVGTDLLSSLGEIIVDVFSSPAKLFDAAKAVFNKYIEIMTAPLKAVAKLASGDVKGALNELSKPFEGIANGAKKALEEVNRLSKAFEDIRLKEKQLAKDRRDDALADSIEEQKIAELRLKFVDKENFSLAERIKAYNEYRDLKIADSQEDIGFAKRDLEIAEQRFKLSKQTIADQEAINEARIKYNESITASTALEREVYLEGKRLRGEANADLKEKLDEQNKIREEADKKRITDTENSFENTRKSLEHTAQLERELLLKNDQLTDEQRHEQALKNLEANIKAQYQAKKDLIDASNADEEAKTAEKNALDLEQKAEFENQKFELDKGYEDARKALKDEVEALEFEKKLLDAETAQEDYDIRMEQERERFDAELLQAGEDDLKRQKAKLEHEARIANIEQQYKDGKQAQQERYDKAIAISQQKLSDVQNNLEQLGLKRSKAIDTIQKGLALAQLARNTAEAIGNTVKGASQEFAKGIPGIPLGILVLATGIATVVSNIAQATKLLQAPAPSVSPASASAPSGASSVPQQDNTFNTTSTVGASVAVAPVQNQKVFLTEADLKASNEKVQVIENNAKL